MTLNLYPYCVKADRKIELIIKPRCSAVHVKVKMIQLRLSSEFEH